MAMSERIRILLVKRNNISESELARRIELSPQHFHNKSEQIAVVLHCDFKACFTLRDSGEVV